MFLFISFEKFLKFKSSKLKFSFISKLIFFLILIVLEKKEEFFIFSKKIVISLKIKNSSSLSKSLYKLILDLIKFKDFSFSKLNFLNKIFFKVLDKNLI